MNVLAEKVNKMSSRAEIILSLALGKKKKQECTNGLHNYNRNKVDNYKKQKYDFDNYTKYK